MGTPGVLGWEAQNRRVSCVFIPRFSRHSDRYPVIFSFCLPWPRLETFLDLPRQGTFILKETGAPPPDVVPTYHLAIH